MDHAPDAHAPHSHGHAHDHSHDHQHHDHGQGEYYLQQLLTVFICGAFGVAGILMFTLGKLQYILAPAFHIWVLVGSLLLLLMTAVRGVALWQSAGQGRSHDHHDHNHDHAGGDCGHDHKHGEACAHGHHHHAHADHTAADHDHGNIYWRVVVLAFPVAILAMGLPNGSFSSDRIAGMLGKAGDVEVKEVADKGDGSITSDFDLLATIAYDPVKREAYTGTKASITGQMEKLTDKQFRLYKMKMTCCSADMIPLQARAIVKNASQMGTFVNGDMIEVRGTIQFSQDSKSGDYLTVLKVDPNDGIRPTK